MEDEREKGRAGVCTQVEEEEDEEEEDEEEDMR